MKAQGCFIQYIILAAVTCSGISSAQADNQGTCKMSPLDHGHIVPNKSLFETGEHLQYKCDMGYMSPLRNIVDEVECLSTGWSTIPQCVEITCAILSRSAFLNQRLIYNSGEVNQFVCRDGFKLKGSDISQCYYYGWDPPLPTCEVPERRSRCPPSPRPSNTEKNIPKDEYYSGDRVQIKCNPDFQLHGSDTILCDNGNWTSPPQCIRIKKCGNPPAVQFGTVALTPKQSEYYSGSVVTYRCRHGFQTFGSNESVCIGGKWSAPPICLELGRACSSSPPAIRHGEIKDPVQPLYASGSVVEYQCQQYYKLQGNQKVRCENGQWSDPPVCLEPCTVEPRGLAANNIQLRWKDVGKLYSEHDSVIEFSCLPGFEIQPPASFRVKCNRGKVLYPKCFKQDVSAICKLSEDIINKNNLAELSSDEMTRSHRHGVKVTFRCKPGFHSLNSNSLKVACNNGEFKYPECFKQSPCRLSAEKITQNHLVLHVADNMNRVYQHGMYIPIRCKPGYLHVSFTSLKLECYNGIMKYPKCFDERPCRLNQERIDDNYLELNPLHDGDVYYGNGEVILFVCKPGYVSDSDLSGLCIKEDIIYPACHEERDS
ncbi:coagulation factor XIII B chain-like isoform X1 [Ascaphus truei]|uniref:coagulation factor XIII B chain-like isoform X1 n=1 Tax=Ascaphus truei TaxID=8439 RepID=UPI003F5A13F3